MIASGSVDQQKLHALARRLIWWKAPADTLSDPDRLLAQVMFLGTWNDIQEARQFWSPADFREALQQAPPGLFDPRSWSYWHLVLDLLPVPPLPTRKLPKC